MSLNNIIKVKNITKIIKGKNILDDISFNVNSGECIALIGPNGAGKTTLMNCLLGNKFINSGSIKINSLNPGNQKLKEFLNILSQENVVPEKLKVKELLDFIQKLYKNPLTNEEIDELLRFDESQKDNFASKLSGGQKRLLSFIITLIGRPKLIFLDEPTAGMDTSTRIRFWEIVNNLKNKGLTIIYSSHYIEEVEHTADRILVLNKGKLVRDTTPHAMRAEEIEKYNIYNAARIAMQRAVEKLDVKPDFLLIDAMPFENYPIPSYSMVKGDEKSVSIAAASVIAKVYRDNLMKKSSITLLSALLAINNDGLYILKVPKFIFCNCSSNSPFKEE